MSLSTFSSCHPFTRSPSPEPHNLVLTESCSSFSCGHSQYTVIGGAGSGHMSGGEPAARSRNSLLNLSNDILLMTDSEGALSGGPHTSRGAPLPVGCRRHLPAHRRTGGTSIREENGKSSRRVSSSIRRSRGCAVRWSTAHASAPMAATYGRLDDEEGGRALRPAAARHAARRAAGHRYRGAGRRHARRARGCRRQCHRTREFSAGAEGGRSINQRAVF